MEIEKYKILETDFNGKGVSAQPNPMQKTEEEAKAVFDELVKDVVTPKYNDLVEALKPIDLTSDKDKPVSDAQKEALDKKVDKELRTGSTEKYKVLSDNNYSDEERDRVYNTLAKDNEEPFDPTGEYHPATKKYVDDKVLETGAADMTQAVYDPTGQKRDMFAHEKEMGNPHGVTAEQVGAAVVLDFSVSVGTVWTGEEAPFTQTITVDGILATDEPIVDVELSDDYDTMIAQLEDYAKIIKLVTANGKVTVYFNDQTLEVLTLRLKVVR